mmetsp:Transcript_25120/g.50274  ORF Transcript_25120/g.50274 Transcript_25120/m.50274 type:complete len:237 (-) Transcript_25120:90-800(-)
MSSGSILLQQLRSRQSKSSSNNKSSSDGKNEKSDITTSSRDGTAVNPPVAAISQRKISLPTATKKKQVIEVCLGPDCAVAGGGAALLEIEDLVRQQQCNNKESNNDDTKIIVQPGGCRDHCTEGPNVRLISCNGGGVDADFHKVNNPEACRRVVSSLFPRKATPENSELHAAGHSMPSTTANGNTHDGGPSNTSSSDNVVVARLLLGKEDAKRWKAHRERAAKERRLQAISRSQGM